MEQLSLSHYKASWPSGAWQLNQDSTCGSRAIKSDSAYLHTLIHKLGLVFAEKLETFVNSSGSTENAKRRWLCASEALVAQGFPIHAIYPHRSCDELLCSFNLPRESRRHRAVAGQAGNSMHVTVIGIVQLAGYMQTTHISDNSLFSKIEDNLHDRSETARKAKVGLWRPVARVTSKTKPRICL